MTLTGASRIQYTNHFNYLPGCKMLSEMKKSWEDAACAANYNKLEKSEYGEATSMSRENIRGTVRAAKTE